MIKSIRDYIKDNRCTSSQICEACASLADGDTLCLEGMKLDISTDGAYRMPYALIDDGSGSKPTVFPLSGKKNITIDGQGAELILHGHMMPFGIDKSSHITLKNLTVDYKNPFYAQAKIVEADTERVLLQFDGKEFSCRVTDGGHLCFGGCEDGWENTVTSALTLEFDPADKRPVGDTYFFSTDKTADHGFLKSFVRDVTARELGSNLIELTGDLGFTHTVGFMWVCAHASRTLPGILITDSSDVTLSDVTLHHAPAFGIFCVTSENITLERVTEAVRPGSERVMSVNADAAHFASCRGKITIRDCRFTGMLDDTCNIHGMYLTKPEKTGENAFIATIVRPPFYGANIFRQGDRMAIIDRDTMTTIWESRVLASEVVDEHHRIAVKTADPLPVLTENHIIENLETAPEVHIDSVESGANRPRGFLLTSAGKTVVENCHFFNMNDAIKIGAETINYFESGAVTDVTIRGCYFDNAAYKESSPIVIWPKMNNRDKIGYFHGKVTVENNRFRLNGKCFLEASNLRELIFRDNTYLEDTSLPPKKMRSPDGISVVYCQKAYVEAPTPITE